MRWIKYPFIKITVKLDSLLKLFNNIFCPLDISSSFLFHSASKNNPFIPYPLEDPKYNLEELLGDPFLATQKPI